MVVKVVLLYPQSLDVDTFTTTYVQEHLPLVPAKIPGLTRSVLSKVLWSYDDQMPFFLLAELYFPSLEALQNGLTTAVVEQLRSHGGVTPTEGTPFIFACTEEVVEDKKADVGSAEQLEHEV